ncbi:hypothetical protein [Intestinibacter sp.]|uniref:hypothetical protein n=1 Tax=Intestinibacter sp. TaxID=1965304 RepID=UPI002A749557|nr:hypothetical protein [Intestinibacter sp.]MDY2736886.1 hypothetical protein [Intestinibacter sp.]
MMLLDSWNPVFRVRFENDKSLNEEFEYKEEALEYAKFHLDSKPIVEGLEVYINDLGIVTEEAEPEEIYSYLTEAKKEEEPKVKLDRLSELEAELNRLENDEEEPIAGDSDFEPESSITIEANPANPEDVNVISPVEEPADVEEPEDFDPYGFVKGAEVEEPSFVDPFATDFSDISEDEAAVSDVINHGIEPVDFLNDLAKQLGIADDVIITSASEEFPEAEPIETCSDEFGAFNCFDDEEPKTEVVVTAEVPADTIDQISSENATVNVDVDGVEAPAETVSTCTVCPECGKEVCCDDKECCCDDKEDCCDDEQEPLNEYHDHEDHTIESEQELKGTDNAVVKCKVADVVTHSEDEKPVDCKLEKPALEEPLAGKKVDVKLNEATKDDELPVDPEAAKLGVHTMLNNLVADEIEAINGYDDAKAQIIDTPIEHKDSILDTIDHIKGEEQEHIDELIDATTEIPFDKEEETHDLAAEEESLGEETHAKYAKPAGDKVKAYNNALKYAKKENKPFIYGYTNHTGKFFAADTPMKVSGDPVDAEKEFRNRYKNCSVVYIAYPDKEFIKETLEEPINEELKVIVDFSDYTPWSGAVDTYDVIERAGKLDELEAYLESVFPDGATTTQINDLLWFDGEEVLEALGLTSVEAEDEMSDQELAEKLWNAHCEKVKAKK